MSSQNIHQQMAQVERYVNSRDNRNRRTPELNRLRKVLRQYKAASQTHKKQNKAQTVRRAARAA